MVWIIATKVEIGITIVGWNKYHYYVEQVLKNTENSITDTKNSTIVS